MVMTCRTARERSQAWDRMGIAQGPMVMYWRYWQRALTRNRNGPGRVSCVNGGTVGRWNGNRLVFWPGNAWMGKSWAGVKLKRGPLDGSPGLDFPRRGRRFCTVCVVYKDRIEPAIKPDQEVYRHDLKPGPARTVVGRKLLRGRQPWKVPVDLPFNRDSRARWLDGGGQQSKSPPQLRTASPTEANNRLGLQAVGREAHLVRPRGARTLNIHVLISAALVQEQTWYGTTAENELLPKYPDVAGTEDSGSK
jgi:hypothetical protein